MSSRPGVAECLVCDRVRRAREGRNPFLIAVFGHSIFVGGDHQSTVATRSFCSRST